MCVCVGVNWTELASFVRSFVGESLFHSCTHTQSSSNHRFIALPLIEFYAPPCLFRCRRPTPTPIALLLPWFYFMTLVASRVFAPHFRFFGLRFHFTFPFHTSGKYYDCFSFARVLRFSMIFDFMFEPPLQAPNTLVSARVLVCVCECLLAVDTTLARRERARDTIVFFWYSTMTAHRTHDVQQRIKT